MTIDNLPSSPFPSSDEPVDKTAKIQSSAENMPRPVQSVPQETPPGFQKKVVTSHPLPESADAEKQLEAYLPVLVPGSQESSEFKEQQKRLLFDTERYIDYVIAKERKKASQSSDSSASETETETEFEENDTFEWQMDFSSFLDVSQPNSTFGNGVSNIDFAVAFVRSLGHAGAIFFMGIHVRKANEILKLKEKALEELTDTKEKAALNEEIEILKKWVRVNNGVLVRAIKYETLALAIGTPELIASSGQLFVGATTVAGTVFSWLGVGADMIGSGIRLKMAHTDSRLHETWAKTLRGPEFTPENAESVKALEAILSKQKEAEAQQIDANKVKLMQATEKVIAEGKRNEATDPKSFDTTLKELRKIGWDVSDGRRSLEEWEELYELIGWEDVPKIKTWKEIDSLIADPVKRSDANLKMVRNSKTLSGVLRNGLRMLAAKKAAIDTGFVKLRLNRARALFSTATILVGLMVALKVVVALGVAAILGTLIIAIGYVMLAATVLALIIGAIYLRVKKPNLFKEYLNGVKTKLLLHKIPFILQSFRLQKNALQLDKLNTMILMNRESLLMLNLPRIDDQTEAVLSPPGNDQKKLARTEKERKKLETKIEKDKKKLEALRMKVDRLAKSVEKHNSRVKELQQKLDVAGWKDYLWHFGKESGNTKITPDEMVERILEGLMSDPDLLEDNDMKLLLEELHINLESLKGLSLTEVEQVLRAAFASEDEETIYKMKKQALRKSYGEGEAAA